MTRLSVNINKVALLRNSRGGNLPDVLQFVLDCESYGAQGITVHPRPDERHIRYQDVRDLKPILKTELNVEGYPDKRFMDLVLDVCPTQCTLVPDPPGVLTSSKGWDTRIHKSFLTEIIASLNRKGIRVSVFVDPDILMVEGAAEVGAQRVELYTGKYAQEYVQNPTSAIQNHLLAEKTALALHLGVNAGHDLNLLNLTFYRLHIPSVLEVSIGHALISDALYFGLRNVIAMYRRCLQSSAESQFVSQDE